MYLANTVELWLTYDPLFNSFSVAILPTATPLVLPSSESTIGVTGSSVSLGFTVSMDQPPVVSKDIHWSFTRAGHEATDIAGSVRQTFSLDKLTLTISDLNTGDEGTYTILASNQVGSSSATVFLDIQGTHTVKNG